MAAREEELGLARVREQELVPAGAAVDADKPLVRVAACNEALADLLLDRAPNSARLAPSPRARFDYQPVVRTRCSQRSGMCLQSSPNHSAPGITWKKGTQCPWREEARNLRNGTSMGTRRRYSS
jgi:hypothetical protein